jgi:hypothetical protein
MLCAEARAAIASRSLVAVVDACSFHTPEVPRRMTSYTRNSVVTIGALVALVGAGIGYWAGSRDRTDAARCAGGASTMVRVELLFGLGRTGRPDVQPDEWLRFLTEEVTTRFPDGLTWAEARGQWRTSDGRIVAEPSRALWIWARRDPSLDARVEALRSGWTERHAQESVLRGEIDGCLSF